MSKDNLNGRTVEELGLGEIDAKRFEMVITQIDNGYLLKLNVITKLGEVFEIWSVYYDNLFSVADAIRDFGLLLDQEK